MKRVQSACICQTLHFMLKEDLGRDLAVRQVQDEVEAYKRGLERSRTRYKIVAEEPQADGSVVIRILKQYNAAPVGSYLD